MELQRIPRKSRVIPFGYSLDDTGKILIPIETELQALVKASDDLARTAWDNNNVDGESAEDKLARIGEKPGFITIV